MQYEAQPGEHLRTAIKRIQKELKDDRLLYGHFKFNDINIIVSQDSNIDDLCVIYDLKGELLRLKSKN